MKKTTAAGWVVLTQPELFLLLDGGTLRCAWPLWISPWKVRHTHDDKGRLYMLFFTVIRMVGVSFSFTSAYHPYFKTTDINKNVIFVNY